MAKTKNTEKIYWSINKAFRLGADAIQPETRFSDGRVESPAHTITFFDHIWKTSRKDEQDIIENCDEYKQGHIRVLSSKELDIKLAADKVKRGEVTAAEAFGETKPEETGIVTEPETQKR